MYKQASEQGQQEAGTGPDMGQQGAQPADDDVVDADFEEVKDDK
jgi:hypothetical protein